MKFLVLVTETQQLGKNFFLTGCHLSVNLL
nr:MAG TPA: hypothetical protein [Myoviridae sp. ctTS62]